MNLNNAVHTEEKQGYTLAIYPEEYPLNPREEFDDNLGVIVLTPGAQRRYGFGDMDSDSPDCPRKDEIAALLPIYLLDHSGLWISTGNFRHVDPQEWDSGQCGWIIMTRRTVMAEWGYKRMTKKVRAKAEDYLRGEIALLNAYFTNDVYWYEITDKDGEVMDSCGGYYDTEENYIRSQPTYGDALPQGRSALRYILSQLPVDLGIGL